ncbi:MAG: c-type cytochrome, partial [Gemmatimonadota bacterium]
MKLSHPFWQAVVVLVVAYLVFEYVIGYALPALGVHSAPVPDSVLVQYMLTAIVGVLIYMSAEEERWARFREPIRRTLVAPERKVLRGALLVGFPLLVGWFAYRSVRPTFGAPPTLRSVHPASPTGITFRGQTMSVAGLENPLRSRGSIEEHAARGAEVYARNCVPCHGDRLDGQGHFAHAFSPVPADFTSGGTISQLTESYVFWRIAKGGPGLPAEGTPWNSAMPVWEDILTADEIWSVIIFLYEQTGQTPRTWGEEGEGGADGEGGA